MRADLCESALTYSQKVTVNCLHYNNNFTDTRIKKIFFCRLAVFFLNRDKACRLISSQFPEFGCTPNEDQLGESPDPGHAKQIYVKDL